MASRTIEDFKLYMNGKILQAGKLLGRIKGEKGKTYTYMKKSLKEMDELSVDPEATYEEFRKKLKMFEEQAVQFIREQRFAFDYRIEGADDLERNEEFMNAIPEEEAEKKEAIKSVNRILKGTRMWIHELDESYPVIKNAEEQKLAEEKAKEKEKIDKYVNVIHAHDKILSETFIPDKNYDDSLYKKASSAFQKFINRMHREHPTVDERSFIKDDLKACKKAMEEYAWSVREKYGTGRQKEGEKAVLDANGKIYNDITHDPHTRETLEKMTDPVEKKNFLESVEAIKKLNTCGAAIDRVFGTYSTIPAPKSLEEYSELTANTFESLKNKETFWGKRSSNSREFNNFADNFTNIVNVMRDKNSSIEQYREAIDKMEEAAHTYIRAKRVQKGYDTKDCWDIDINSSMIGSKKDSKGPSIFSAQGRSRYDFAVSILIQTYQRREALNQYEEKLANKGKDQKRAEAYEAKKETFMAHKEKLDKEFEKFEQGKKASKGNAEHIKTQMNKVRELSNAMAEKFEKGMDIWSNELDQYNEAIRELKGIEKAKNDMSAEIEEIEDVNEFHM